MRRVCLLLLGSAVRLSRTVSRSWRDFYTRCHFVSPFQGRLIRVQHNKCTPQIVRPWNPPSVSLVFWDGRMNRPRQANVSSRFNRGVTNWFTLIRWQIVSPIQQRWHVLLSNVPRSVSLIFRYIVLIRIIKDRVFSALFY